MSLGIFGLWLVHLGGFGYGAGWVDDSIALYVVALVLGAFGGQRPKQARRLAALLHAEHIAVTEELRKLLDDRLARVANYVSLLAILGSRGARGSIGPSPTLAGSASNLERSHAPQSAVSATVTQLKCTRCGLSVRSRGSFSDRHFCPRCLARGLRHPFRLERARPPDRERFK